MKQKTHNFRYGFLLRRVRDSNPWRCDPQQFSRLPHSTTLPTLQWAANIKGFLVLANTFSNYFQKI